jgi:putative transposase
MIVGWKVSHSLKSDLATDALQMALGQRGNTDALVHHSDRGVQYFSVAYSATLLAAGIRPSVGTRGDSLDNALSESLNGLYKTKLIKAIEVQDDEIAVEWETCKWVEWYNNRRLHSSIGMMSPVEYESLYYDQMKSIDHLVHR